MKCQHQKVYRWQCKVFYFYRRGILEVRPWICAKCLEEGEDKKDFQNEYFDLKKRKAKKSS